MYNSLKGSQGQTLCSFMMTCSLCLLVVVVVFVPSMKVKAAFFEFRKSMWSSHLSCVASKMAAEISKGGKALLSEENLLKNEPNTNRCWKRNLKYWVVNSTCWGEFKLTCAN